MNQHSSDSIEALNLLVGVILRREAELRKGSQTAAVSVICKANEIKHRLLNKSIPEVLETTTTLPVRQCYDYDGWRSVRYGPL